MKPGASGLSFLGGGSGGSGKQAWPLIPGLRGSSSQAVLSGKRRGGAHSSQAPATDPRPAGPTSVGGQPCGQRG